MGNRMADEQTLTKDDIISMVSMVEFLIPQVTAVSSSAGRDLRAASLKLRTVAIDAERALSMRGR